MLNKPSQPRLNLHVYYICVPLVLQHRRGSCISHTPALPYHSLAEREGRGAGTQRGRGRGEEEAHRGGGGGGRQGGTQRGRGRGETTRHTEGEGEGGDDEAHRGGGAELVKVGKRHASSACIGMNKLIYM